MRDEIFCMEHMKGMCGKTHKPRSRQSGGLARTDKPKRVVRHTCSWERRHGNCNVDAGEKVI